MKVLLHARILEKRTSKQVDGIPRFSQALYNSLPIVAPQDDFIACVRTGYKGNLLPNLRNRTSLKNIARDEKKGIEWECRLFKHDVSYSLNSFVATQNRKPRIGIVCDLTPVIHPDLLLYPHDAYQNPDSYMRHLLDNLVEHADFIHCISETTKVEMMESFKISPDRLFVSYPCYLPLKEVRESIRPIEDRYVFTLGSNGPRKNFERLIEAFLAICHRPEISDVKLVIGGKQGISTDQIREKISRSGHSERIVQTGFIADDQLANFYKHAELFAFPSITEGFGIPVIEAMVQGCPVVSSRGGALSEVVADAGLLFDPLNVEEIGESIFRVLTDHSKRKQLSILGEKRAKRFDPMITAKETIDQIRHRVNGFSR